MIRRTPARQFFSGRPLFIPLVAGALALGACGDDVPTDQALSSPEASMHTASSTFEFEVVKKGNKPVEGAVVALIDVDNGPMYLATGSDGKATFTNVGNGSYCATIKDINDPNLNVTKAKVGTGAVPTFLAPQDPEDSDNPTYNASGNGQSVVSEKKGKNVKFTSLSASSLIDCFDDPAWVVTGGESVSQKVRLDNGNRIRARCRKIDGQMVDCGVWALDPVAGAPSWAAPGQPPDVGVGLLLGFTDNGAFDNVVSGLDNVQLEALFTGSPLQTASKPDVDTGDNVTLATSLAYCALDDKEEDSGDANPGTIDFQEPVRTGYTIQLGANGTTRGVAEAMGFDYFQVQSGPGDVKVQLRFRDPNNSLGSLNFEYSSDTNGACFVTTEGGSQSSAIDPVVSCRTEGANKILVSIFIDVSGVSGDVTEVHFQVSAKGGNDKMPDTSREDVPGFFVTSQPNQCNLLLAPGDGTWWIGVG